MKKTKIKKIFIDREFGFPVKLLNVPMIKVRGIWTPHINYNLLSEQLLKMLCQKPIRLTGNEIRFIRFSLEMSLQDFAKRLAVTHVAVIKWEKMKNRPTPMNCSTEKDLRLFLFSKISSSSKAWAKLYQSLEEVQSDNPKPIQLDLEKLAA